MVAASEQIIPNDDILVGWYGPEPRLATADEFASYVETFSTVVGFGFPSVRLAPAHVNASHITISVQVRATEPVAYHGAYLQDLDGSFTTGRSLLTSGGQSEGSFAADEWHTFKYELTAGVHYSRADVEAALAAGRLAVLSDVAGGFHSATRTFTSQIRIDFGVAWLRNRGRDDGLGNNAPRNYPRTSQQRSLRNRGYR